MGRIALLISIVFALGVSSPVLSQDADQPA
ncbi:hypothetical protein BH23CHL5_BH23CHL5_11250 [soil metagenome]